MFQTIMRQTTQARHEEYFSFLRRYLMLKGFTVISEFNEWYTLDISWKMCFPLKRKCILLFQVKFTINTQRCFNSYPSSFYSSKLTAGNLRVYWILSLVVVAGVCNFKCGWLRNFLERDPRTGVATGVSHLLCSVSTITCTAVLRTHLWGLGISSFSHFTCNLQIRISDGNKSSSTQGGNILVIMLILRGKQEGHMLMLIFLNVLFHGHASEWICITCIYTPSFNQ